MNDLRRGIGNATDQAVRRAVRGEVLDDAGQDRIVTALWFWNATGQKGSVMDAHERLQSLTADELCAVTVGMCLSQRWSWTYGARREDEAYALAKRMTPEEREAELALIALELA